MKGMKAGIREIVAILLVLMLRILIMGAGYGNQRWMEPHVQRMTLLTA
jgi:hypothetical protein